jgi:hypothetical protein
VDGHCFPQIPAWGIYPAQNLAVWLDIGQCVANVLRVNPAKACFLPDAVVNQKLGGFLARFV